MKIVLEITNPYDAFYIYTVKNNKTFVVRYFSNDPDINNGGLHLRFTKDDWQIFKPIIGNFVKRINIKVVENDY
jgi:hypothetical protein